MKEKIKCGEPAGRPHEMDELLEEIWTQREEGRHDRREILANAPVPNSAEWLSALEKEGLVSLSPETIELSRTGEKVAEQIIRRHRLTERLFSDVFDTPEEVWEREACELEHQTVLVEEAVNAVCAFLGHPPTCPHGKPIPRGICCKEFRQELRPFVIPLSSARISKDYRIVFIAPKSSTRLDRLAVLGILPGSPIKIYQKRPSFVVRIGETDVALDEDIARGIYVKSV